MGQTSGGGTRTLLEPAPVEPPARIGLPQRIAAFLSVVMGITGVVYWVPALLDWDRASIEPGGHPVAFIQRVVDMAAQQFTPGMIWIVPFLGALFTVASLLQIPAGIAGGLGRVQGIVLLRVVAYAKLAMFIGCFLLLGLALFSNVDPGDPRWRFSALNWIANLGMIALYGWFIRVLSQALPPLDGLPAGAANSTDEDEE